MSSTTSPALTGIIEWPNGLGYTPCTPEYEDAKAAADDAAAAWQEVTGDVKHPEYAARYDAMCRAEDALGRLQAQGGHMGAPVRFARAAS